VTDRELLEGFENCTLPNEAFHHQEHVRVAFLYLSQYPVREAFERFSQCLVRFAAAHGKSTLYKETLTLAYLLLIRQRVAQAAHAQSWEEFKSRNLDLLDRKRNVLKASCEQHRCLECWEAFVAFCPPGY
jgi:aspartate/methionine/tyrosine aminotransferase